MMATIFQRILGRARRMAQGRIRHHRLYLSYVSGKRGLEIGGPSAVFRSRQPIDLYDHLGTLDNCDFARSTVWAEQQDAYVFAKGKLAGCSIFCDGSALEPVADGTYDFILSSHNLEHFANPVKALMEWKRVLGPSGALILVLPYYKNTFDHRREPTNVDHIFSDYEHGVGEDDLTHLPEILEKHDLSKDPGVTDVESFRIRSLKNIENRCLHHHVFDEHNSRELIERAGFAVHSVDRAFPFHLCLLATKVS
jgi:SAM-dependent methyltransferase